MDGDRSKGFGFVTISDESADKVIEALDGQEIQGRRLKVAKAKARSDSRGGRRDNQTGGKPQRTSREMQARKEEGLKD
jgi:RNA recognition motif-containing protein